MTWLLPIGLLGLTGLIALIVIYIIRPNYQTKFISSTYVWRLSLRYRKNKIPISRLNNILLFLCQFLALTICGLLLAHPVLMSEKAGDDKEKVLIIDASASMLVTNGEETRLERAIEEARLAIDETIAKGGVVSVIIAESNPRFLAQRTGAEGLSELHAKLDELAEDNSASSYASANVNEAVALAEDVLRVNSEAGVYFYTDTKYIQTGGIQVVDIADRTTEWNAAVLDCSARMNENNHYEITAKVGCYGKTEQVTVHCEVHGVNGKDDVVKSVFKSEYFDPSEEEKAIVFSTDDFSGEALYSFEYIEVYVECADSFLKDNSFFLYGGRAPTIRIQYSSSLPNLYFSGVIRALRENMKGVWNIQFTELSAKEKPATEGYDFYIFEHVMPDLLPTDGVVLLVDPNKAPEGSGLVVGESVPVSSDSTLATGITSPLMKYIDSSRITIAKYRKVAPEIAGDYEELAYYNGEPMILSKNQNGAKVVVWAFDLNHSNVIALPDFSFLMYNIFNQYIPSTLTSHSFEIGDTVTLTARGTQLTVSGGGEEISYDQPQGSLVVNTPGTYTVTQKSMRGDELLIENFFVRISNEESNITKEADSLPLINAERQVEIEYEDLMFYFAIGLVSLLFIEWYLHSKKNNI